MGDFYMYIKESSYSDVAAVQLQYLTEHYRIPIGPGQGLFEHVRDIDFLIGAPLKAGDTLTVYNLFLVGRTYPKILSTLEKFHIARIALQIVDINYYDLVPEEGSLVSVNSDYLLLSSFLKKFRDVNIKNIKKKNRKRGRPSTTWEDLSEPVQNIIQYHVHNLYKYPEDIARHEIEVRGQKMGTTKFRELKRYYRNNILPNLKPAEIKAIKKPTPYVDDQK